MDDLLAGLNKAQRAAVTSDSAVLQVLAPPGSGKTKTLTARVGYLITQGLKPWDIIVCTFTVKAAKEMQERIGLVIGEDNKKKLKIGTFHGVAIRYLRQYQKEAGLRDNFGVADSSDSQAIVERIVKGNKEHDAKKIRGRISKAKSQGLDCDTYLAQHKGKAEVYEFAQIFREYQHHLDMSNLLDYDDILLRCVALLQSYPQCVANIQAVLVDEFQDTNKVQFDMMALLAQRKHFITIVGDPDQSIYGWRTADVENLNNMRRRWPDTRTINLEENYRSSGAILHAAQAIIDQDTNRPQKKLQATHSFGHKPVLRRLPTSKDEAAWLVTEIKRARALTGDLLQHSDFAVLLRSASLSRLIEHAFVRDGIPYRMVGGSRFYDRKEVQIILDYMRVIHSSSNSEAMRRILNVPSRNIGENTMEQLNALAERSKKTWWDVTVAVSRGNASLETKLSAPADRGMAQFIDAVLTCKRSIDANPDALVKVMQQLMKKIGYEAYIKSKFKDDYEKRWANVEELMAQAADASMPVDEVASSSQENAEQVVEETPLGRFLANAALAATSKDTEDAESVVTISTIHAAKGLEWPIVFIPSCFDGSIPHSKSEDQDEERRLLYVGMTRAKGMLQLSCPVQDSKQNDTTLSCFLSQSGIASYFDEKGPDIRFEDAQALAHLLAREAPKRATIAASSCTLEREKDDWWPLNGEVPLGKPDELDLATGLPIYGTTRSADWLKSGVDENGNMKLQTVFVSAAERHRECEQEAAARMLEQRLKAQKTTQAAPRGRKRQIAGQGTLSGFVQSSASNGTLKRTASVMSSTTHDAITTTLTSNPKVLRDVTNSLTANHESANEYDLPQAPPRIRTQPAFKRARTMVQPVTTSHNGYVFLSSSPTKAVSPTEEQVKPVPIPQLRAAATLHTTSMSSLNGNRRTLGVRRSLNGWSSKKH